EDGLGVAYRRRGYSLPADPVLRISPDQLDACAVRALLDRGVTGVVVENDELARALVTALHELGCSVPAHLSVAKCGDPHFTWDDSPDWTMFTIPRREMGSHAVRFLDERMKNPSDTTPRSIYLPCRILPGHTIAPPCFDPLKRR
ncbi:MAG TPA: substrate-binding domain-containing protein, partial [Anaerolineaceae bacterium]|nr:substrate-binding domain-containing protein [Anaerolineaceae bacterium]